MDIQKLKDIVEKRISSEKCDLGEFAKFKGKMMKITTESYNLASGGTLTALESKGMAGLMRRDMLVVNSIKKDVPILVMQYMAVFGKRLLQIDFIDIVKDKTSISAFNEAREIGMNSSLMEMEMAEEWYSPKRLPGSCNKQGKKAELNELSEKILVAYLGGLEKTRETNAIDGRSLRINRFLSELFDHGCFGYDAIRVCLKQEKTEELYKEWIFGAKCMATEPRSQISEENTTEESLSE